MSDDNERQALAEVMREQKGLPSSSDHAPTTGGLALGAIGQTLVGIIVVVGGLFTVFFATDACFRFKVEVARSAGSNAPHVMFTKCTKGPSGCECETDLDDCESGMTCSFSEQSPNPSCGERVVSCVEF